MGSTSRTIHASYAPSTSNTSSSTSVSTVNLNSSTQIKTGTTISQPVNSSPSITNPEYSFTTTSSSQSLAGTGVSAGLNTRALAVGLGLGISMAVISLILSLVIFQQRRKIKSLETNRNIPYHGVPMTNKEGIAATYESLKTDELKPGNRTYEELNSQENIQQSNS